MILYDYATDSNYLFGRVTDGGRELNTPFTGDDAVLSQFYMGYMVSIFIVL